MALPTKKNSQTGFCLTFTNNPGLCFRFHTIRGRVHQTVETSRTTLCVRVSRGVVEERTRWTAARFTGKREREKEEGWRLGRIFLRNCEGGEKIRGDEGKMSL